MKGLVPLVGLVEYLRSKNAGPFRLTLDIVFRDRGLYEQVKQLGAVTPELIARLYHVSPTAITNFVMFDPGKAIKITMIRRVSSGSPDDTDVYGAQQHAPLLEIMVPLQRKPKLSKAQG